MAVSGKGPEGLFTAARAMARAAHDSPADATDPDNGAPAGTPDSDRHHTAASKDPQPDTP